jgi:hypothetical protein
MESPFVLNCTTPVRFKIKLACHSLYRVALSRCVACPCGYVSVRMSAPRGRRLLVLVLLL